MLNAQNVIEDVRAWLVSRGSPPVADIEADLYQGGQVDSFGLIELIAFCEERYGIAFSDSDFANPAFRTLAGLSAIVLQRATPGAAAGPGA